MNDVDKREKIKMNIIEENALKTIKNKDEKFMYFQDIFSVVVLFFSMYFVLSISIDYFKQSKLDNFSMVLFLILIVPFSCFLFIKLSYIIGNFVENKILFKNDIEYQLAIKIMSEYHKKMNENFRKKLLKERIINFTFFLSEIFLFVETNENEKQIEENELNNLKLKNTNKIIRSKIEKKAFKIVKEKTKIITKKLENSTIVFGGNLLLIFLNIAFLEIKFSVLEKMLSSKFYILLMLLTIPTLVISLFISLYYLEYKFCSWLYFRKNKKYLLSLKIVKKFLKKRKENLKNLKTKEKIENSFEVLLNKEDEIKKEKIRIKEFEKYLGLIEE